MAAGPARRDASPDRALPPVPAGQIVPASASAHRHLVANAGQFQTGAPSANPRGRGAAVAKAKRAPGSDGVVSYGGYLSTAGDPAELTGRKRWIAYANAFLRPPVAIAALLRSALLSGVKWSLVDNEAGGRNARKGTDVVQRGLLDARLPKPWSKIVGKAAMSWFYGFSIHAAQIARRPDGLVTFVDIAHRPQHTIWRWLREIENDQTTPFVGIEQRLDTGGTYLIPLDECLYLVNDTLTDSPEGAGVLRLVVERIRRAGLYEALEGSELFGSMGGTPIARVPLEDINLGAEGKDEADALAYKRARTANIEAIVNDRIKTPEKRQYVVLDSKTYEGSDPNTISAIKKWDIEIIKGDLQGVEEIRKVITDLDLDIARMLGVEFVMVGGGDTAGTFGMHESKVSLFGAQLSADLDVLGSCATQQLCRRLVAANGLDPDTCTPRMVASPISTEDVLKAAQTLVALNAAGLAPNHPAKIALFDRMSLPWQDEPEPVLPRMPFAAPTSAPEVADVKPPTNDDATPDRVEPATEDPATIEPATENPTP